jgi:hypothetical protein
MTDLSCAIFAWELALVARNDHPRFLDAQLRLAQIRVTRMEGRAVAGIARRRETGPSIQLESPTVSYYRLHVARSWERITCAISFYINNSTKFLLN